MFVPPNFFFDPFLPEIIIQYYIYTREFVSFEDFRKYMEWAISDYNTKRPHSSLDYMTPDEFESAILNDDFRKKWIEKEIGRYKHVELLE